MMADAWIIVLKQFEGRYNDGALFDSAGASDRGAA